MASQAFLVPTWVPTPSNLHFLAWTCYLVGQHPDVQARMAAEARGLLAGEIPSFEDLPRLSYTER